jgi:hypothetical protein
VRSYCAIEPGKSTYFSDAQEYYSQHTDLTLLSMGATLAQSWMTTPTAPAASARAHVAGVELMNREFANNCAEKCNGLMLWSPYEPTWNDTLATRQYRRDLARVAPNADPTNQLVAGAYVGFMVLVEAMMRVGPYLTRERLRAALDGGAFETGLTQTIDYRVVTAGDAGTVHSPIQCLRAYRENFDGTFQGWTPGNRVCVSSYRR